MTVRDLHLTDEPMFREGHRSQVGRVEVPIAGAVPETDAFYGSVAVVLRAPASKALRRIVYKTGSGYSAVAAKSSSRLT